MELVGPRIRVVGGASMNTFFSLGNVCTGLVAWAVHDWRQLTQVLYGPMLIISCSFWFVPESVRWYMSKGRYEDAEDVLKTAARFNGTQLSEESQKTLAKS
ncbi:organic cation transporter-like protein [Leguminivora glycinivorella]|uniref:organic cation transporter-like protein n=1 Tax=Leguminivora glycinivorella TaxID=1035111 RepID=UPI002010705C|nr:organic cation transporter-like protein [Leguminivora glycinivorella]